MYTSNFATLNNTCFIFLHEYTNPMNSTTHALALLILNSTTGRCTPDSTVLHECISSRCLLYKHRMRAFQKYPGLQLRCFVQLILHECYKLEKTKYIAPGRPVTTLMLLVAPLYAIACSSNCLLSGHRVAVNTTCARSWLKSGNTRKSAHPLFKGLVRWSAHGRSFARQP